MLDRLDDKLYFQNSQKYPIHYEFASKHLSAPAHPPVPSLSEFNRTEYYSLDRRFVLGAVTYYSGPKIWALELSPYDTASKEMIEQLFTAVKDKAFFGRQAGLPSDVGGDRGGGRERCRRAYRSRRPTRSSPASTTSR